MNTQNDAPYTDVQSRWQPAPEETDAYLSVELRVPPDSTPDQAEKALNFLYHAKAQSRPLKFTIEVPANEKELNARQRNGLNPEPAYHSVDSAVVGPILPETYAEALEAIAEALTTNQTAYEAKPLNELPIPVMHRFCDLASRKFIVSDDERPDIANVCLPVTPPYLRRALEQSNLKVSDLFNYCQI